MLRENARIIHDAVCDFWVANMYAPTFEDLENATGLSRGTIQHHVTRLVKDEWLKQDDGVSRSLRPTGMIVDVGPARRRAQGE